MTGDPAEGAYPTFGEWWTAQGFDQTHEALRFGEAERETRRMWASTGWHASRAAVAAELEAMAEELEQRIPPDWPSRDLTYSYVAAQQFREAARAVRATTDEPERP